MSGVQNALACNVQPPQMLYVRDFIMFECSATSPPRVKGCRGFSPTQPEKKRLEENFIQSRLGILLYVPHGNS